MNARVVAVARGDDAAGLADAPHLAQRADRVGEVLQHLVRVHDVERVVGEVERVHVGGARTRRCRLPAAFARPLAAIASADASMPITRPGRDAAREVERDRARPAADVEERRAGHEVRHEVRGGVLDGAPAMRAQHALVVAVRVRR